MPYGANNSPGCLPCFRIKFSQALHTAHAAQPSSATSAQAYNRSNSRRDEASTATDAATIIVQKHCTAPKPQANQPAPAKAELLPYSSISTRTSERLRRSAECVSRSNEAAGKGSCCGRRCFCKCVASSLHCMATAGNRRLCMCKFGCKDEHPSCQLSFYPTLCLHLTFREIPTSSFDHPRPPPAALASHEHNSCQQKKSSGKSTC